MSINVTYGNFQFSSIGNDPTVSFDTEITRSNAGYIIGVIDKIKLNGVIFSTGELNSASNSGKTEGGWNELRGGINFLRTGIKDYESLKITCGNNQIYLSDPETTIIESINFNNGTDNNWLKIIDYTISLSVVNTGYLNYIADSGYYISDFEDSYSIQTQDSEHYYYAPSTIPANKYPYSSIGENFPIYNISRTLSANGIATKSRTGTENAKSFLSGLVNSNPKINEILSNLTVLDRAITISNNRIEGSYGITDNFVAISGNNASGWTDTFTINSEINENLIRTVSIQGTVRGLSKVTGIPDYNTVIDNTFTSSFSGTKFISASGGFYGHIQPRIFTRALQVVYPTGSLTGMPTHYSLNSGLNPIPISINIDHNINEGVIGYGYTYNSRPLSLVSGAITENLNMEDVYATRTYNMQDVYYRMPLPQDIGTYSVPTRSITYEATFPRPLSGTLPSMVNTQISNLIEQFNPNKLSPPTSNTRFGPGYFSWLTANEESYDVIAGKYTKKYSWQYQKGYFPDGFYM